MTSSLDTLHRLEAVTKQQEDTSESVNISNQVEPWDERTTASS